MRDRGYDPTGKSTNHTTPVGISNSAAAAVIQARTDDGANQYGTLSSRPYGDYTGYTSRNDPLRFCTPRTAPCSVASIIDPTAWQPLISESGVVQHFIAPHWGNTDKLTDRS
jgi:hypothetical protein